MSSEIDGLRCCAVVWVVLFHIAGSVPGRPATEARSVAAALVLEVLGVGATSYTIYLYHYLAVLGLGRAVQSALGNDASLRSLGLHCAVVLGATLLAFALLFRY
jgi:peptidoglycan/LPS O-acetylase OafA/YrhL